LIKQLNERLNHPKMPLFLLHSHFPRSIKQPVSHGHAGAADRTTMLAPSDGEQTVFFTDGLDNGCDCFLRTPAGYTAGGAK
jgi:hypothetical protein